MQPGWQQEAGSEGEGGWQRDLRLPEPTPEVAQRCTAAAALAWLHVLAKDPHMEVAEVRKPIARPQKIFAAGVTF